MSGKYEAIAVALKKIYSKGSLDPLISSASPFRTFITSLGPQCRSCGVVDSPRMWHVEWKIDGRFNGRSHEWIFSEVNGLLKNVDPACWWEATIDFCENYGVAKATYRIVYGPPEEEVEIWRRQGTYKAYSSHGKESLRWTSEWKKKWEILPS